MIQTTSVHLDASDLERGTVRFTSDNRVAISFGAAFQIIGGEYDNPVQPDGVAATLRRLADEIDAESIRGAA